MIKRKQPLPKWYTARPKKDRTHVFWLHAFNELSSCRQFGMGPGPIPWTAIKDYAEHLGIDDPDFFFVFKAIIREMDATWRNWASKQKPQDVEESSDD